MVNISRHDSSHDFSQRVATSSGSRSVSPRVSATDSAADRLEMVASRASAPAPGPALPERQPRAGRNGAEHPLVPNPRGPHLPARRRRAGTRAATALSAAGRAEAIRAAELVEAVYLVQWLETPPDNAEGYATMLLAARPDFDDFSINLVAQMMVMWDNVLEVSVHERAAVAEVASVHDLRELTRLLANPALRERYDLVHALRFAAYVQQAYPTSTRVAQWMFASAQPRIMGEPGGPVADPDAARARELASELTTLILDPAAAQTDGDAAERLVTEMCALLTCAEMTAVLPVFRSAAFAGLQRAVHMVNNHDTEQEARIDYMHERVIAGLTALVASAQITDELFASLGEEEQAPTALQNVSARLPQSQRLFAATLAHIRQAQILGEEQLDSCDAEILWRVPRFVLVRALPELMQAKNKRDVAEIFDAEEAHLRALCRAVEGHLKASAEPIDSLQKSLDQHIAEDTVPPDAALGAIVRGVADIASEAFTKRRADMTDLLNVALRPSLTDAP